MEWMGSKLNIDLDVMAPKSEHFQNKYITGARLLLLMKSDLVKSGDQSYLKFIDLYEKIGDKTLLDFDRAYILYQSALATKHINGCSAECGVFRGGGSVMIANVSPERPHYALDTYEGFPDVFSENDVHIQDSFSNISLAEIEGLFKEHKNINMLKGPFSESFQTIKHNTFSFVYVDADLYISTRECLDFFYSRLSPGGIMLFDDYLIPETPGVKKAVDEFFISQKEYPMILPTFQAMVTKI